MVIIVGSVAVAGAGSKNKYQDRDAPQSELDAENNGNNGEAGTGELGNGNPNLDTEARKFHLGHPVVPEATKASLADSNSLAAQALDWVVNDEANNAFAFGQVGAFQEKENDFMQRFAAASLGKAFDVNGFDNQDG